jgi:hypothetical protein
MIYAKSYSTESEGLNKELSHLFLDFYVAGRPPASVFEFFLSFFLFYFFDNKFAFGFSLWKSWFGSQVLWKLTMHDDEGMARKLRWTYSILIWREKKR